MTNVNPERIFLSFISVNSLVREQDKILLCVSGGSDSVAMLHLFKKIRNKFNLSLSVAHFNHMIRKDSVEDVEFVSKLCKLYNLPFYIEERNIKEIAEKRNQSIEECARIERYDFFLGLANMLKIRKIATAHTMDDQAETILMRVIKGSGLLGLSGILPSRYERGVEIIRPLLAISKDEILEYLHKKEIIYRTDSTNNDTKFFRNKIRLDLIPNLEKNYNSNIKRVLANMAENISEDYTFLERIAERYFDKSAIIEDDAVKIPLYEFNNLDKALKKTVVRKAIEYLKGDLQGISFRNWLDIEDLVANLTYFKHSVSLPGNIIARKDSKNLILQKKGVAPKKKGKPFYLVKVPGEVRMDELGSLFNFSVLAGNKFDEKRKAILDVGGVAEFFDLEKVKFPILVRFKKPGDKMIPLGMDKPKRLQDIFVDEKVPFEERSSIPLLISRGKILWVAGFKVSNEFKVTKKTTKMLKIEYQRLD